MNNRDQIRARARAYELFAELFTIGMTKANLAQIKLIPALNDSVGLDDISSADEAWQSDHYDIFGKNVFPYESIYLDEDMNLGGEIAETITDFYHQIGYEPPTSENADHIGVELAALAFLCQQELQLVAAQDILGVDEVRVKQQALVDEHIMQWLLLLQQALRGQQHTFYNALCELTLELLLDHRAQFSETDASIPIKDLEIRNLLLDDNKTGIKDIALYLLTPINSGVFISHSEISAIAKQLDLPRGFGNRVQMLMNLFRAAISFDALPGLLDEIRKILHNWTDYYAEIAKHHEALKPIAIHHSEKVSKSLQVIMQVKDAAQLEAVE